jgi:hypothetical protein
MFCCANTGTGGGSLSPSDFFVCCIYDLLSRTVNYTVGSNNGGIFLNILAYGGSLVLVAPSWQALQQLADCLNQAAKTKHAALRKIYGFSPHTVAYSFLTLV